MVKEKNNSGHWLGLMIGNSRLHWAQFRAGVVHRTWDSLPTEDPPALVTQFPLVLASVVPAQVQPWQRYSPKVLQLADIPLQNIYPTLGIDRALALWGAGTKTEFPCLVIDGGTALTLTAADAQGAFWGGAILPGLTLQCQSLGDRTAALPQISLPSSLPPRWGHHTPESITSGIIHIILGGLGRYLEDWWQNFPQGTVYVTGGDGERLTQWLRPAYPGIHYDPQLIFQGMAHLPLFSEKDHVVK